MTIDRGKQFAYRRWLEIQIHRTSMMVVVGIDEIDHRPIDFLWDIARVSLYDRKDHRERTMNPL